MKKLILCLSLIVFQLSAISQDKGKVEILPIQSIQLSENGMEYFNSLKIDIPGFEVDYMGSAWNVNEFWFILNRTYFIKGNNSELSGVSEEILSIFQSMPELQNDVGNWWCLCSPDTYIDNCKFDNKDQKGVVMWDTCKGPDCNCFVAYSIHPDLGIETVTTTSGEIISWEIKGKGYQKQFKK